MGYTSSKAFAAGSCKSTFCHDYPECQSLSGGSCRHREYARPSMSGFGINVPDLMKKCAWSADFSDKEASLTEKSMSWLAGLVLIGM
jgi:predicted metal-binding protein